MCFFRLECFMRPAKSMVDGLNRLRYLKAGIAADLPNWIVLTLD
jgi:hypothetical protein